ncbi:DUF1850 domain-containing protein [Metabacillus fastidiosus]|uniref:DUF1850 domain-containing protein n=1 Tax=Metabacillus fastidiosus TaxID=1458 RepID=UPI002E1A4B07|nr:DUF1850 domain-containing protein [Metabacillus fastidiosus]
MRLKLFIVLFTLILISIPFFPYKQVVAFTFEDREQLLAYLSLEEKESFQIQYTHSIHNSDVTETYRISSNEITQTELAYKDFAVGMPSDAEGNELFIRKGGIYYIKNMKRTFSYIDLRIGQVKANHRLIYEGKTYQLSSDIKPGTWVRITPKKITLWQQLKGVKINDS